MQCHAYVLRNGLQSWDNIGNSLIDIMICIPSRASKNGVSESLIKCPTRLLFHGILYLQVLPEMVMWSQHKDCSMRCQAMEGNGERELKLFHEILGQGVVPDEVVFCGVLTACSHAGLLDEALDFINTMPVEPNGAICRAFLAACRIHKNEKMATYAAELITKSAKDKTGAHVLLPNIYASAAKWDDVAKVRMQMKEKGMKKTPGSSSIEVKGVVHEFTSGDESHPENVLTASMLQEINCGLKHAGYVPDLTNVLLDIDKQEKEILLNRHSEKLAIAFGLVSSSQGMPIRVVTNLPMCSDCHHLQTWCQECATGR
ncbi:UNVERIFIED_CONTAM: Pentatricopeptide repeat-containing protein [Sesamum radiatum]|uniref:Pentatricopeptide repeat-containing protein n=1 Tax=Sesamum radiatum TaxID=300843 RepID=A0AAW2IY80_SESRA